MAHGKTLPTCPECGAPLPGGALAGICAACAWRELGIPDPETAAAAGVLFAVPGHEVLAEIARGGGGIVYRARQQQPRREVALKMLPPALLPSRELQARFRLEAETIATLHHPAILPVFTVGEKDGLPYFTMKLAAGGTLSARREQYRGRWREIATLVTALAEAVQHAHSRGVVHRDLKPGNVLFDDAGQPYVSDFGLAKFTTAEPSATRSQVVMGTPAYLAPEVLREGAGAATTASDVYGLGAILYELLAGRPPFAGESVPELLRQVSGDRPRRPSAFTPRMPRDLEVIALSCLEKEPAKRPPSAAAVAEDLHCWLEDRPIRARPVGAAERLVRWARRNPALAGLSGLLTVALAGGGVALERSNVELRRALGQAEAAERLAQERLHGALLDQARLLGASGRRGQRHDALEVLARAAAIRPAPAVRHEVAAALARPDLQWERPLRAYFANEQATVAFAPDFQSYLTATGTGDFALLSAAEGAIVRRFQPAGTGQPLRFAFSGDGQRFLVHFTDGRSEVWARDGAEPLATLPPRVAHGSAAALHPREPIVAWAAADGSIRVRSLPGGGERLVAGAGPDVRRLGFAPGGTEIAVVRADRVEVREAAAGAVRWRRDGTFAAVDPAWSLEAGWLAVADENRGDVLILAGDTGRVVQELPGGGGSVPVLLAFAPGSHRLAVVASDAMLRVWEVQSGEQVFQTGMPPRVLAFSPDGRHLAGARRWLEIGVWAWAGETVFREWRGAEVTRRRADALALSPDGRWLASSDPQQVRVWDGARGEQVAAVPLAGADWTSVHFDPHGGRLLYSAMNRGVFARDLRVVTSPERGRPMLTLGEERPLGPARDGRLLGFGANGDWYVDRGAIERLVVWPDGDPARERIVAESRRYDRPTFSRDGRYVAAMGYPRVDVRVTTVGPGATARRLPLQSHAGAGFSPDGRWLVTGTETEFQAWSLPDLLPGPQWPRPSEGGRWGTPVFSPDGRWVAGDRALGEIEVREARNFVEGVRLAPPRAFEVNSGVWSPDGDRLYLLGTGHRIFEWDLAALRRELAARGLDWR